MNIYADSNKLNRDRAVTNAASKKQGGGRSAIQFVNNRPEAIAQRKLQDTENNSPQTRSNGGTAPIQLMSDKEIDSFLKEAEDIANGISSFDEFCSKSMFLSSARFIARKPGITVEAAKRELDIEALQIRLCGDVANREKHGENKSSISDSIAALFSTNLDEVVTRYIEPFLDANQTLPDGFRETVQNLAYQGARDIMPMFTKQISESLLNKDPDKLAFMNRLDKYISANINFARFYGKKDKELGDVIHFIWSGRPISEGALENILKWQKRAEGTSWQVVLWSDKEISSWEKSLPLLEKANIKLSDVTDIVDPRFKSAYQFARQHNLAGASDLIRLSLLNRFGGAYVDVDIGPGDINLNEFETPSTLQRPILAPGIRDAEGVRNLLKLKENEPITEAHVKKAARILQSSETPNNNFIASAPGALAMNPIINQITKSASKLTEEGWKNAGGMIAGVSGPMMIGGVLDKMTDKGQLEKSNAVTDQPLEWLTPESEDQNWKK